MHIGAAPHATQLLSDERTEIALWSGAEPSLADADVAQRLFIDLAAVVILFMGRQIWGGCLVADSYSTIRLGPAWRDTCLGFPLPESAL